MELDLEEERKERGEEREGGEREDKGSQSQEKVKLSPK